MTTMSSTIWTWDSFTKFNGVITYVSIDLLVTLTAVAYSGRILFVNPPFDILGK